MATLLDWNALKHKIDFYLGNFDQCINPQVAFSFICMEYLLDLTPEEIEDSLTDGASDRGVDAVYIDERDGRNTVHLFQFKHVGEFKNTKKTFPSNEIDKILSFIDDLLNQEPSMEKTCNQLLWNKVKEVWIALDNPHPHFEVHFCGNLTEMIPNQKDRVASSLNKYRHFDIHHHSIDSLVNLFISKRESRIDARIRIVDKNYFERSDGNIKGLIATVEAKEIVELIRDPANPTAVRESAFNDNVRIYLTKRNRVNRTIYESALSSNNTDFWYLNNGITMTCDSFSYTPGSRAPIVSLENIQIVNGGQTSHALFEAHEENEERLKSVLVLLRIYETKTRAISNQIAESTNSQTPINSRDLRSNDDIQKKLEESFADQGIHYERKAKQYAQRPKAERLDALAAGQANLAYIQGLPEVAKKDRSRVFGDLYDTVFNDATTPDMLLVPYRVFEGIELLKREVQKKIRAEEGVDPRMLFLIDGAHHVLFTVAELCEASGQDPLDFAKAIEMVPQAVELVANLVDEESSVDEAFSFNRFFKDAKTKRKIERCV